MTAQHSTSENSGVNYRILRQSAVVVLVGLSDRQIRRLIAKGEFPAPLELGPGSVGWRSDEVQAWLDARPRVSYATPANGAIWAELKNDVKRRRAKVRAIRAAQRGAA